MERSENLNEGVLKRQAFEAIGKNLSLQKTDSAPTPGIITFLSRKLTKGQDYLN